MEIYFFRNSQNKAKMIENHKIIIWMILFIFVSYLRTKDTLSEKTLFLVFGLYFQGFQTFFWINAQRPIFVIRSYNIAHLKVLFLSFKFFWYQKTTRFKKFDLSYLLTMVSFIRIIGAKIWACTSSLQLKCLNPFLKRPN